MTEIPLPGETAQEYWRRCGRHDELRGRLYYVVTAYNKRGQQVPVQWTPQRRFPGLRAILGHFQPVSAVVTCIRLRRRSERRRNDSS